MIKEEIVSFIQGHLPKEDKTGKWHYRRIEAEIERVIIEMYNELFAISPLLLDKYTKTYGVPTPIAITQEGSSGIYYSTLPVQVVGLNDKASGVRHIYPVVASGNIFVPMDAREADMIFNTDVAIVTSKIGYRVRQDSRVDYYNTSATIRSAGVRMDLLIPFSVYEDSDVVLIPEVDKGEKFLDRVLKALGVIQEVDLIDDNSGAKEVQSNNK